MFDKVLLRLKKESIESVESAEPRRDSNCSYIGDVCYVRVSFTGMF